jgi:hypothetical protein
MKIISLAPEVLWWKIKLNLKKVMR